MRLGRIIGTLLIIVSLVAGYFAYDKLSGSSKSVDLLGLEIEASDQSEQTEGYIYIALAVVLFGGGMLSLGKS